MTRADAVTLLLVGLCLYWLVVVTYDALDRPRDQPAPAPTLVPLPTLEPLPTPLALVTAGVARPHWTATPRTFAEVHP